MRSIDAFGYETTFDSPEHAEQTLTSWNATARAFLSHAANTPVHLSDTLKLTPDFALAQLAKGYFMLLLGRRELIPAAQEAYDAVTPLVPALTPREKAYHDGLGLYLAGRMGPAADVLDAALRAVEDLDSDGDGVTNVEEIQAGSFPGDARSLPGVGGTCSPDDVAVARSEERRLGKECSSLVSPYPDKKHTP